MIYVRKKDMFEYVFVIKRFSVTFPLGGLCVCVVMYCTVKWCDCVPVMISEHVLSAGAY